VARVAQRVVSVMTRRPVNRMAPMAHSLNLIFIVWVAVPISDFL